MFSVLTCFLIGIVVFCCSCIALQAYFLYSKKCIVLKKIPGPKLLPIIGNVLDICHDEEGIFNKLREFTKNYYPLYTLWSTVLYPAVNIICPEDMQLILSNTKHNEKGDVYTLFTEWLGEGLLTSSGDLWQQRRKLLTPSFHFNILKQFISIFNSHSTEFVNDLKTKTDERIDLLQDISTCSLHMIIETAMGATIKDKKAELKYRTAIHDMGEMVVYRLLRPWYYFRVTYLFCKNFYRERFVLRYLKTFTRKVIAEREKHFRPEILKQMEEKDDSGSKTRKFAMLDILIAGKLRNEINSEGVREEVDTFMFEGHDTISRGMSFCFMLLACNKHVQDKIFEELSTIFKGSNRKPTYNDLQAMNYMEMAIKESLRLYPSVPLISRVTGEDALTHSGHIIPKGTILLLHIYDTHRHPDLYPDPEKYDPDRFLPENAKVRHPYAYLPFSAGSRNCIGQKYAMLSMKSILCETMRNFELLPVDTPDTITLVCDMIIRSKNKIRIRIKQRDVPI